ncbi:MAG: hypothetical protein HY540_05475 [Deltaproteobacteria bacterium]|nr:hypothetical protein [Deltaproteobacteria bacterium]
MKRHLITPWIVTVMVAMIAACHGGGKLSRNYGLGGAPDNTDLSNTTTTIPQPTTPETVLQCLDQPKGETKIECDPCFAYLPQDVDLAVSLSTNGLNDSVVLGQLQKNPSFARTWKNYQNLLPKRACLGIKFTEQWKSPVDSCSSTGAPLISLSSAEEIILVLLPEDVLPSGLFSQLNQLGGSASTSPTSTVEEDGLTEIERQSAQFGRLNHQNLKVYYAEKEHGPAFIGTPAYIKSAFTGPNELACLSHAMNPMFQQFPASHLKAGMKLSEKQFEVLAKKYFIDDFAGGPYRHLGLALNLSDKRSSLHAKAFAGRTMDDPVLEFLVAVDFRSLDLEKTLQSFSASCETTSEKESSPQ